MVTHTANRLEGYFGTDEDVQPNLEYHSFLDKHGNWYIEKYDLSAGTMRYVKGSENYATSWTNRATLTYDYFNEVFGD